MKTNRAPDKTWHVGDLIDLEYFLRTTSEEKKEIGSDAADAKDRRIYLEFSKSHDPPFSRGDILKFWLAEKRKNEDNAYYEGGHGRTPGGMFHETLSLARFVIIITAMLSGMALAWSVLSYSGNAPINIFTCLWVFIFPQILMLIILSGMAVFRRMGLSRGKWGIYPLTANLLRRAAIGLKSAGEHRLSAQRRQGTRAVFGMIGHHKTIYGSAFYRPVFILFQVFGVCFNIGLLGAALFKIMITDLAFGWQTTLQAGAKSVHALVGWMSLPWSWLTPLFPAHPTLSQIQGSRIVLKDGMAHLATPDLVSWWPFLVMAILVYGLLPRIALLAYGIAAQARALNALDFSHSACDRLIQRMQVPRVETGGIKPPDQHMLKGQKQSLFASPAAGAGGDATGMIVGVPVEIDALCTDDELSERIGHVLGPGLIGRFRFTMDPETDAKRLQSLLLENRRRGNDTRILLLQEAWLPPIRETLSWIRTLRQAAGPQAGMIMGLIGKPVQKNLLTPPADADRIIWERAVTGLGDPYIRVETLGG